MVVTWVRVRATQLRPEMLGLMKYRLSPAVLTPYRVSLAATTESALGSFLMEPLRTGVNWLVW